MIPFLFIILLLFCGCDTDVDKSVTGDFVIREPRSLEKIAVTPDSLITGNFFSKNAGSSSYALAGKYEGTEAFALFKFSLSRVNRDSLVGAYIIFDIDNVWRDGDAEFNLYETHSDWFDTTRVDNSILESVGLPISTVSDTAVNFSSLSFDIDPEVVKAWSDNASVLIRNSDYGVTMVSILTDDTNYPPSLKLIRKTESGNIDTTAVSAVKGTYNFNTGYSDNQPVISDGDASGFVLLVGLSESLPPLAVVNKCILKMTVLKSSFPDESFGIKVYKLKSAFTTIEEADRDTGTIQNISLSPDESNYELDITGIVNDWHIGEGSNYGLLFESAYEFNSPGQCIFSPSDSLFITYTPYTEIK